MHLVRSACFAWTLVFQCKVDKLAGVKWLKMVEEVAAWPTGEMVVWMFSAMIFS
jgi:hypothetical protein